MDLLVKLYELEPPPPAPPSITVRRAMVYELSSVTDYVRRTFSERWASEATAAMCRQPVACFVALKDGKLVGFSCYDTTFKGFFGPIGVSEVTRGTGLGTVLIRNSLWAMQNEGYAYAIIGGGSDARDFYEKSVGATLISGSHPGAYHYDLTSDG